MKKTKGKAPIQPETGTTHQEALFSEKLVELLGKGTKKAVAMKEAAEYAYKPGSSSIQSKYVYVVAKRERVQKYISELLNKAGLGHEAIMRDLRAAITMGLGSGDAKVSDALKGLDIAIRLQNLYPATKIESKSVKYNADLMGKSHKQLDRELKELENEESELIEEGEIVDE